MRNKLTPDDAGAEDLAVPTGGTTIRGTLRRPARGSAQRCIVIHPATAVPEALYTGFAEYLAGRGAAVITYDYRGMGRTGSARAERDVRMRDWIDGDAPAMTRWATERFPDLPQVAVGHSVGGHALALGAGGDAVRGFVTVASHAGVTAAIPAWGERMRVRAALGFVGPALSRVLGYCPGWVGLGEDLPGAAMREWSRWTEQPGYFFDDPTMAAADRAAAVTVPVLAIGFTDDLWATPGQIEAITDRLVGAAVERRTWSPGDIGADRIGHMGFFKRAMRTDLWAPVADWLEECAAADLPA